MIEKQLENILKAEQEADDIKKKCTAEIRQLENKNQLEIEKRKEDSNAQVKEEMKNLKLLSEEETLLNQTTVKKSKKQESSQAQKKKTENAIKLILSEFYKRNTL